VQIGETLAGDGQLHSYSIRYIEFCAVEQFARTLKSPFSQRDAERKILEILRGRHHHSMGYAVVNQRDRNLFDDVLSRFPRIAVDPALSRMVDNDGRDHDHSSAGEDLRAHHPHVIQPPKRS
jgi:hypothetical protein